MRIPKHASDIDVTWVNTHLGAQFDEPIERVAGARVGAAFGLVGVTYRVVVRTKTRSRSFAVKVCGRESARKEACVYEQVLPMTSVPAPVLIGLFEGDDEAVLVTDFVDGKQGDVLEGCTQAQSLALAQILADLHAPWWGVDDQALPKVLHARSPRTDPIDEDVHDRCVLRHEAWISGGGETLRAHLGDPARDAARLDAQPMTVAHYDYHLDNVLFTSDGPVVLDWEKARRAPAASDVARLIVEGHTAAQHLERDEMVRRAYLDRLRHHGVTLDPATLDEGIEASKRVLLAGAVRWAGFEQAVPAGSRQESLQRNLLRNLTAPF